MTPGPATPPVTRPLTDLDQVPWAELRDAHGPATDAPKHLRALAGHGEDTDRAWRYLWSALHDRGIVYEAAPHAVPFLLHLAVEGTVRPDQVLYHLREMLPPHGDSALRAQGYDPARSAARSQRERELETAFHAAVAAGVPLIAPMLDHPDPAIAGEAAHSLAWFPDRAADILPALRRLCVRPTLPHSDRTTALISLGLLAGACGDRSDAPFLERILADGHDPARWAAALALVKMGVAEVPPAAFDAMTAELVAVAVELAFMSRTDDEDCVPESRTRFCYGAPERLIHPALNGLPVDCRAALLAAARRTLVDLGERDPRPWDVAWFLVSEAHADARPTAADALTPWQQVLLRVLSFTDWVWASGELGGRLASEYGMPETPDALRAWLDFP
ncbi:HEAT repeat domain-containing protein [Streptomyces collinus]|uniref:HEAT repeat domain-containing protein n=1 Tax=Streptomyces collinus TaxID=42684 RepID=UPI00379B8E33